MYDIINIISQKYTRYNRSEYRDFEIEKVLINENIIEACDELVVIIRNNIYVLRHIIDKTKHEIEISKEQYKVRILEITSLLIIQRWKIVLKFFYIIQENFNQPTLPDILKVVYLL